MLLECLQSFFVYDKRKEIGQLPIFSCRANPFKPVWTAPLNQHPLSVLWKITGYSVTWCLLQLLLTCVTWLNNFEGNYKAYWLKWKGQVWLRFSVLVLSFVSWKKCAHFLHMSKEKQIHIQEITNDDVCSDFLDRKHVCKVKCYSPFMFRLPCTVFGTSEVKGRCTRGAVSGTSECNVMCQHF